MTTNSNSGACLAPVQKENYSCLQIHVKTAQDIECEKFRMEFKKLPRKLRLCIIRLVKEYNYTKNKELTEHNQAFEMVLSWLDCYCVLNYSPFKMVTFINQLFL